MFSNEFNEKNWQRLIDEIDNGQIIPIIGPELLVVKYEGTKVRLYDWIASQLACRLEVDVEPSGKEKISDVIYRYKAGSGHNYDPTQPYYEIFDILRNARFETPEALKILASIEKLKFFLSTTFDSYLETALDENNGNGPETISLSFAKSGRIEDISPDNLSPAVYHIFGKANKLPTFVATEEDLLEFNHKWNDPERRPVRLNSLLKGRDKYYLMLGCSYENWLTRSFLYSVKSETIFDPAARKWLVADQKSFEDESLRFFLSRCNAHIYSNGDSIEFIRELGRRWNERIIPGQSHATPESTGDNFTDGSVFLSYANEDKEYAMEVRTALEAVGIDVWFDQSKLEAGDAYQEKIIRNIRKSLFFIPLISMNTLTPERRFFRFEWNEAIKEMGFRPSATPYILPVMHGNVPPDDPLIPEVIQSLHCTRLNDESSLQQFALSCRQHIRNSRRS